MSTFLYAERIEQVDGFRFITWADLVSHVEHPPRVSAKGAKIAKRQSPCITASNAPDKTLATVIAHDVMTVLRLDLDDTQYNVNQIKDRLELLGVSSYIVHTTASHKQGNNGSRYRVFIELDKPINLAEWTISQTYLAYVFGADDCSSRPQQVMFLPVLFGGVKYEHFVNHGKPLALYDSQVFKDAVTFDVNQKQQAEKTKQEKASAVKEAFKPSMVDGQISVIDAVNQHYEWAHLLRHYGYKKQGRAWLPPESTSKTAGAYILSCSDGKQRYFSHHTSDPCSGSRCLDQFDFIAIRSFAGNRFECMKGIIGQFPDIDSHNKAVFAQARQAEFDRKRGGMNER
ncbi:hypothetical protein GNY17_14160 [Vibrio parahaemolyticus]|uniref:hypothetical protein n=1 Tax=Vibrio parahaemolyticus TaxID=670 RepID=UPI0012E12D36|nr:hypothetical protein [Vibrio parahaemolyticus]EHR5479231.1 hypothetical protein [Vibrio parahaemolyticus]EJB8443774.1 hypothetical protein [Vibrio parahaemolyticus]MBY3751162.1 hypothetical protein [Vibrio parahaemolyticus]MBY3761990.1 hypothetical protein [Vibrio parahaemolyticus]MBY3763203.1 hypothetical protein [Vibrio parahaemolyticus]